MQIGKPKRSFFVRIVDLKSNKSKNISIYGDEKLDRIHAAVRKGLEEIEE